MEIQKVKLGVNGPEVVPLCVGTWAWGDKGFWGYGQDYGETQVKEAFEASLAAGVNFFDTAEVYGSGLSEQLIGKFIKSTNQSVQVTTKYGPLPWRFFGQSVLDALTNSLSRLQLDEIPLYQIHWPFTFFMNQETILKVLAREVHQGRIKAIGVSNYSASEMLQAHQILKQYGVELATNQIKYSLVFRRVERLGIIKMAQELGVTILAYSPLAQGLLTGKYGKDRSPTGPRSFDSNFSRQGLAKIAPLLSLLEQIANKYDATIAQVALNWVRSQPGVIPIAGAKTAPTALENAQSLNFSLNSSEIAELEEISRPWLQ